MGWLDLRYFTASSIGKAWGQHHGDSSPASGPRLTAAWTPLSQSPGVPCESLSEGCGSAQEATVDPYPLLHSWDLALVAQGWL